MTTSVAVHGGDAADPAAASGGRRAIFRARRGPLRAAFVGAVAVGILAGVGLLGLLLFGRGVWMPVYVKLTGGQTVAEVLTSLGPQVRQQIQPHFTSAGVSYAPDALTLLAIKDAATMEVWTDASPQPRFVRRYDIEALSGVAGPKLREGDRQVPEGIYRVEALNPNSSFHLSMKLDYPNAFDRKYARREGRMSPGSDIFIHGKATSVGCLAMGDEAIEELFVLVHDVGVDNVRVIIAPSDPRTSPLNPRGHPVWVNELYRQIETEFRRYTYQGT